MKAKVLILLIISLCGSLSAEAQKRKPKPKSTAQVSIMEGLGEPDESSTVPQLKDFAYLVEIDENSNIKVTVQASEDLEFLTNTADIKPVGDFFSGAAANSKTAKSKFQPIVIVRAQPSLNFGILVDVINKLRTSSKLRIKLETAPSYYVFIPAIDNTPIRPRPNPLSLVVSLDSSFNIKLNMEPLGTLNDTAKLDQLLKQIFHDREVNGVFRSGTNDVESTVFVKADRSVDFKDVIKLIDVVRTAGASPIGLQVDDLMVPMIIMQ